MGKRDSDEGFMISETGNWNVAAEFSKEKIMKPMVRCEVYEDIAAFGYEDIFEELMSYGMPQEQLRLSGLKRLIHELRKICKNCRFAMKKSGTKEKLEDFEKKLNIIKRISPLLYKKSYNQITKISTIRIEEVLFSEILERLSEIKADLNDPLNKNHLIFTDKEEFDPIAYKKQVIKNATTRG